MKPPMKKAGPATKQREAPKTKPAALPMPGMNHDEMKFRAQDALHTLKRAHEIQSDPALMKHVQAHVQIERDALKKIARKGRT
jgi:hypothetical protein